MIDKRKITIGVIFGSRSVEHDVSIVTANQVMRALDSEKYDIVPIYIRRDGGWYSGEPLKNLNLYKDENELIKTKGVKSVILSPNVHHHGLIFGKIGRFTSSKIQRLDVIFPVIHGSHGEDGTLQGLFEIADIPYVGCGVLASAVANDKLMTKTVLKQNDIPVVDCLAFSRADWIYNQETILQKISAQLSFPLFVKPITLGSSIGVAKVEDESILASYMDIAFNFDSRVLVETAVSDCLEINCSLLGNSDIRASVLEQPITWQQFLTYEEKYLSGSEGMKSAERIIPAPISQTLTTQIQEYAIKAFRAIEGRGIARIDFLVKQDTSEIYLNEINTLPGSLAFYLWEASGVSAKELVDELVELAFDMYRVKRGNNYDYRTALVELNASRGLKGLKGIKTPRQDE